MKPNDFDAPPADSKMKALDVSKLPLDSTVLIEASAGTGKTYTIGLIVQRLLTEKLIPIDKIVLITFTKAATAELKKKTAERIREYADPNGASKKEYSKLKQKQRANLLDAIARMDEMRVFTIHGFCQRLLAEFSYETNNFEQREIITDEGEIISRITADFWRHEIKNLDLPLDIKPDHIVKAVKNILNHPLAAETMIGEDYNTALTEYQNPRSDTAKKNAEKKLKFAIAFKLAKTALEKLAREKEKQKVMGYSDMIENCYKAVLADKSQAFKKAVQRKYKAILVDEFQDTDNMQFIIFSNLFKGMPFFMIGDPKQAIYRFRSGDIFAYKEARGAAKDNQFVMDTNYRSESTLLNAINQFFNSGAAKGKMGEGIKYEPVKCGMAALEPLKERDPKYAPFVIWQGESGAKKNFTDLARRVIVAEVKRLLNTGKISPREIAILPYRNEDCHAFKKALMAENIPAIVKGTSVYSSTAANFVLTLFNAICRQSSQNCARALLTHELYGLNPDDIDDALLNDLSVDIYETKQCWERHGVVKAVEQFMSGRNLWNAVSIKANGERNITNIRQVMELLNEEEIKFGRSPEKIYRRYAMLCNESTNGGANEDIEEKLETDDDALKIMTIHSSKGLEFPIVFVPDVSKMPSKHNTPEPYIYHDPENQNRETLAYLTEDKAIKELLQQEENEEIARLLYVALTRAKQRVYAAFSPNKLTSKGAPDMRTYGVCNEIFDNYRKSNSCADIQIEKLEDIEGSPTQDNSVYSAKQNDIKRSAKIFNRQITESWRRTSFTMIARHIEENPYTPPAKKVETIVPSGKRMGTLLHSIFEELDFMAKLREIELMVENKLSAFAVFTAGEEAAQRKEWVQDQVQIILDKELEGGAGKLNRIDAENRISELDFFMSINNIGLDAIKNILGGLIGAFVSGEDMARYLNGAIDLVFLGEDHRYYIIDWKSNNLAGYSRPEMEEAMFAHAYHLQYHIYAVALKRHLEQTKKGFDFARDFGGVYYVFIRGVNSENNDGIYFVKGADIAPKIAALDDSFDKGGFDSQFASHKGTKAQRNDE